MFSLFFWGVVAGSAAAKDRMVEPMPGALSAVLNSGSVSGGDRLILEGGRHGAVILSGVRFVDPVTIVAQSGSEVFFDRILLKNTSGLVFSGVTVMPTVGSGETSALIETKRSHDIVFERMEVASARSAKGWSPEDWVLRARTGFRLFGQDITVRNSVIRIVDHGVSSAADGAIIEGNEITYFRGDGIRALGDNSRYVGNLIETCVGVDSNHDDGIQSWSVDAAGKPGRGVVKNVLVAKNVIRNGVLGGELACSLQGIGLFDGMFEDWIIRDNVVIVDHWHGITVMGGNRVRVENNVVVDSRDGSPGPPWITVTSHRDGRISRQSLIAGNVTQPRAGGGDPVFWQPQPGVVSRGNKVVQRAGDAFR